MEMHTVEIPGRLTEREGPRETRIPVRPTISHLLAGTLDMVRNMIFAVSLVSVTR